MNNLQKHTQDKFNEKATTLLVLALIQVFLLMVNGWWSFVKTEEWLNISAKAVSTFSFVSGTVVGLITIFLIREIVIVANREKEAEAMRAHLEESKELVDLMRMQRHDFLNHLQVILGSIQLNKLAIAIDYIKDITANLNAQSSASRLEHPEIAALLLKKLNYAEARHINLELDLGSGLKGLNISPTTLSRIIGNLLDNAMDAVDMNSGDERCIEVSFYQDTEAFFMEVFNFRPVIPCEIQSRIFEKGFTTKGTRGSGLGLHIVKELVEANRGSISFTSNEEEGTTFTVRLPKEEEQLRRGA